MRRGVELLDRPSGSAGTHLCWGFDEAGAFMAAANEFLAEGAERGQRLVYLADAPAAELAGHLAGLDAEKMVGTGVLITQPVRDLLQPDGTFDGPSLIREYQALVDDALADGYAGLRVVADASVLAAADPKAFAAYELMADRFLAKAPMAGMCAFSAATPGLSDLFAVHRVRSADGGGEPTAGAWFDGHALRLVGEVDLTTETLVESVIVALMAGDHDETLDLSSLEFIDVRSLSRLDGLVGALLAAGRQLRVLDPPAIVRRCCEALDLRRLAAALESR